MNIHAFPPQGTTEWKNARVGKVTASRVADLIAKTQKGAWAKSRENYMVELIAERLTGRPTDFYVSPEMRWGTETEPEARRSYEFYTDIQIELVGFIDHPTIENSGASPDGLVGSDGMVEFKCPTTTTHINTISADAIPADHITQMNWQMACKPERKWCDFVSYDPRLPEAMRMFVRRLDRDEAEIAKLTGMVTDFLTELKERLAKLAKLTGCVTVAAPSIVTEPVPFLDHTIIDGTPAFLRRSSIVPYQPSLPGVFDAGQWLAELTIGLRRCADLGEVQKFQNSTMRPAKKLAPADAWKSAEALVFERCAEIGKEMMAAE